MPKPNFVERSHITLRVNTAFIRLYQNQIVEWRRLIPLILIIADNNDISADLIVLELQRRQVPFRRLDLWRLSRLATISWFPTGTTSLEHDKDVVDLFSTPAAGWIKYGPYCLPLEQQYTSTRSADRYIETEWSWMLEGILQTAPINWLNSPQDIVRSENKLLQLNTAVKVGLSVPETVITNSYERFMDILLNHRRDYIIKPIRMQGGYDSRGEPYLLYTHGLDGIAIQVEPDCIKSSPLLIQKKIPRKEEVRVTFVDGEMFCMSIAPRSEESIVDLHKIPESDLIYSEADIPKSLAFRLGRLLGELGLGYAGIDLIVTPSEDYVFLEVNPTGQWGWVERATGQAITSSIVDALIRRRVV